jgi:hypothetical protein
VQTFFQEQRYRRYFLVQKLELPLPLPLLPEQRDASQTSQRRRQDKAAQNQAAQDQAESYQQRLACLSYQWDAVKQKDSKAIERIAEEVSAKDYTG